MKSGEQARGHANLPAEMAGLFPSGAVHRRLTRDGGWGEHSAFRGLEAVPARASWRMTLRFHTGINDVQ